MDKINDLIKELCPNGVEKVSLGSLMSRKKEKNFENSGVETVYSVTKDNGIVKSDDLHDFNVYSSDLSNYYILRLNQYAYNPARLNIGSIARLKEDNPGLVSPMYIVFELDSSKIDYEYYEHLLFSSKVFNDICSFVEQGARFRFDYKNWDKVIIDLPPIKVQKEIVRILNKFKNLEYELQLELDARKSQYEFWRDRIFKFENRSDVKWLKLGDIKTDIYRGNGIKRSEVTENGIPCVRYGEIYMTYNIWFDECKSHTFKDVVSNPKTFTTNDLLFVITGESVEDISKTIAYTGNDTCYAGGDIVVMKHKQNGKYLSYALSTSDAVRQKGKGKVKSKVVHSNVSSIEEIIVPIVSLEEQEGIVKKLDHFYNLVNSLDYGLPVEIELRKQQYEYYRNKLLSFEEIRNE